MHKWLICIDIDEDIEKSNRDMQSKLYFTPVFQILESLITKKHTVLSSVFGGQLDTKIYISIIYQGL